MRKGINRIFLLSLAFMLGAGYCFAQKADEAYHSIDIIAAYSLTIGKWMIAPDKQPARWLDAPYHGKSLREPINIILVDERTSDLNKAKKIYTPPVKAPVLKLAGGIRPDIPPLSAAPYILNCPASTIMLFPTNRLN